MIRSVVPRRAWTRFHGSAPIDRLQAEPANPRRRRFVAIEMHYINGLVQALEHVVQKSQQGTNVPLGNFFVATENDEQAVRLNGLQPLKPGQISNLDVTEGG
jgi:hypothetical protein